MSRPSLPSAPATAPNLAAVYQAHGDFLWLTLRRLGVRDADRDDALQDVLVVVHHRLHTFDGRGPLVAWLFGVCVRVAAAQRRRAHVRREQLWADVPEDPAASRNAPDPEEALVAAQSLAQLRAVLDEMDLEKRAVFVMYELDEVPAAEIATVLGLPFNTVHSRLRAARAQFERIAARRRARDRHAAALVLLPWIDGVDAPHSEALTAAERARHAAMLARVTAAPAPAMPVRGVFKLLGGASAVGLALALVVWPREHARTYRPPVVATPAPAMARASTPTLAAPVVRVTPPTPVSAPPDMPVAAPVAPRAAARAVVAPVVAPVVAAPSPPSVGAGAAPTNPLDREVTLLGRAQAMLDDDPAGALAQLDEYAAEFPRGELSTERDFLAVRALLRLGRRAEASSRAEALIARDPRSPFVRRVRRMLAEATDAGATIP